MTIIFKNGNARRYFDNVNEMSVLYDSSEDMHIFSINGFNFFIHPTMVGQITDKMDSCVLNEKPIMFEYEVVKENDFEFKLITAAKSL